MMLDPFYDCGPTGWLNSEEYTRSNGCHRDGCVGYGLNDGYASEEENSEDYDGNKYNSHGNDSSD